VRSPTRMSSNASVVTLAPFPLSSVLCATTRPASPSLCDQVTSASAVQASMMTSLTMTMTSPLPDQICQVAVLTPSITSPHPVVPSPRHVCAAFIPPLPSQKSHSSHAANFLVFSKPPRGFTAHNAHVNTHTTPSDSHAVPAAHIKSALQAQQH
jgi:hypothetical protein